MRAIASLLLGLLLFLTSCTSLPGLFSSETVSSSFTPQSALQAVTLDPNFKKVMGQTIYVPTYSHIYYENSEKSLDLAITLSIRNTDLENSIFLTSVRYYDTYGKLTREYVQSPLQLQKLASGEFVVNRTDRTGGSGSNFIVEWMSDRQVSEPIIEAVMISAVGNQNMSFLSVGKAIKNSPQKSDSTRERQSTSPALDR